MERKRTALIAGATGLTGSDLLSDLLSDGRYTKVTAFVRRTIPTEDAKLTSLVVDFDALPLISKVDDAYCCLGSTLKKAGSRAAFRKVDFDYVVNFARSAKEAGAVRFAVISSLGADAKSAVFYSRVKGEMENALRTFEFDALHIFQPSLILGKRQEQRPAERAGIAAFSAVSALMFGPLRKYRPIESRTIAKAMINAAFSNTRGTHVYPSDAIGKVGGK